MLEAAQRVAEAAQRHAASQPHQHQRLIRAQPYGDDSTSVGDALRRAAADLLIEADGRDSRR